MVEEKKEPLMIRTDIAIKKCEQGFMVLSSHYGLDEIRAFSTAEGLIEWLSRELGAGPIVWYVTLEIWAKEAGVTPDDLVPLPDRSVDPEGYAGALYQNSVFVLRRLIDKELEGQKPKPPPEPKVKKEKKVKGKEVKVVGLAGEKVVEVGLEVEEEKPKE